MIRSRLIQRAAQSIELIACGGVDREIGAGNLIVLELRRNESIFRWYVQTMIAFRELGALRSIRRAFVEQTIQFRFLVVIIVRSFTFRIECQIDRIVVRILV